MTHPKLEVEKWVWTEEDFEFMGWHDVRIHAMSAHEILVDDSIHVSLGELLFDIDYILKWHLTPDKHYQFWVSPATLAFQNVWDLKIATEASGGNDPTWDICDIHRKAHTASVMGKPKAWSWNIELHGGMIDFFATGYEQYIRKEPALIQDQHFSFKERGGASFLKQAANGSR